MLIRGNVEATIDGQKFRFEDQAISMRGVGSLPWGTLIPRAVLGKTVDVDVSVPSAGIVIQTKGRITSEATAHTRHMGIHFMLDTEQQRQLGSVIETSGFQPTAFVRKYPRVPSMQKIQIFPLRAHARRLDVEGDPTIVFDVANVSPNGALICTENQLSLNYEPGEMISLTLEPRGWFQTPILLEALICRITDDVQIASGNLERQIGVQFSRMDPLNRSAFMELLKHIVQQLKPSP